MVEVTMPDPEGGSVAADSSVPSGAAASTSSAAPNVSTLVEKAISVLHQILLPKFKIPRERLDLKTQNGSMGGGQIL